MSLGTVATGPSSWSPTALVLGDGQNLSAHGIFGADPVWQEYALGDFTLTDSYYATSFRNFPPA